MASLQDKPSKPVSHLLEYQTIQDFAAATDDRSGSGDNQNSKIYKTPVKSPPPPSAYHHSIFTGLLAFLSPNQ